MKKKILLFGLILSGLSQGFAQDAEDAPAPDGWTNGGSATLTFNQSAFSNWAAGGENVVSLNGLLTGFADYKKGKGLWSNSGRLSYGLNKIQNDDLKKTDDQIQLFSKYGYQVSDEWYTSIGASFISQFAEGFEYPEGADRRLISNILAPAYVTLGVGMDWIPNEYFTLNLSPATARWIIVADDTLSARGAFGVDTGSTVKTEFGAGLRAEYKRNLNEDVYFGTSLGLFSNYLENPQNVDVVWNGLITANVWKYISVSLSLDLIYDFDTKLSQYSKDSNGVEVLTGETTGVQLKQVLGIGLTYSFGDPAAE